MRKDTTISVLGCGWLGLPLATYLAAQGYTVKGSTRQAKKLALINERKIQPFLIEVNKKIKGTNLQHFFSSDILIINFPPGRKRRDVARSHPQQIAAIIEKASTYGVKKILFISSTSVYSNNNLVVTESDEPRPTTPSGIALVKAEELLMQVPNIDLTILRFGGLVGGDRQAGRFLAGKKDVKNGLAPVNLIHQEDCIVIISQIIEGGHWGELFNACADEHPSRKLFYSTQAEKQGFEAPEFADDEEVEYKEVSNFKLKQALSYSFIKPDPLAF